MKDQKIFGDDKETVLTLLMVKLGLVMGLSCNAMPTSEKMHRYNCTSQKNILTLWEENFGHTVVLYLLQLTSSEV